MVNSSWLICKLIAVSSFLAFASASCYAEPEDVAVSLQQVEILPGICASLPTTFRRIVGYPIQPVDDFVEFQLWGWKDPDYVRFLCVSTPEEAEREAVSSVKRHADDSQVPERLILSEEVAVLEIDDIYAELKVKMLFSLLEVDEQKVLFVARCIPLRGYCEDLMTVPGDIHRCRDSKTS